MNQIRSVGREVGERSGPEVQQLQRQLAAIRRSEQQRQCTSRKSTGGLFDPCRDLASRRSAVQRQLDQAGQTSRGRLGMLKARLDAQGCTRTTTKAVAERAERRKEPKRPGFGRNTLLYCVRLADGYYFPAPNSQFVGMDFADSALERCRFICDTQDVALFKREDMSSESEEMVSIDGERSYGDLPSAFRYREQADFKACNFRKYAYRIHDMQMSADALDNLKGLKIPLPMAQPLSPEDRRMLSKKTVAESRNASAQVKTKVRVVLPDPVYHEPVYQE